ncbi:hypothetical protein AQUCO_03300018v1, partial [Aquilegia coerulea]
VGILCRTTVSTVRPGPNPNNTPHSIPSPVVAFPSSTDLFLISSRIKRTVALVKFPYSLKTFRVALSFSSFKPSFNSIWSRIAGPRG